MHFPDYPRAFPSHSRAAAATYRVREGCFAAPTGTPGLGQARVLFRLPAEGLSVFDGEPPAGTDAQACRPVYALSEREPPAVPTGRVFVQAAKGALMADLLRPLGYVIESVPSYAPSAAWIAAADQSIATALANLGALMGADGIESAEPQMLRPSADRG